MADQHCIRALRIQRSVRLEGELETGQRSAAGERQRHVEVRALRNDGADGRLLLFRVTGTCGSGSE
jgi:hypothetical protein